MKYLCFFWTDDKTGNFSDTTLRTWIIFVVFLIFVLYLMLFADEVKSGQLEILNLLSLTALGQGGLYLGKRFNERRANKDEPLSFSRTEPQLEQKGRKK